MDTHTNMDRHTKIEYGYTYKDCYMDTSTQVAYGYTYKRKIWIQSEERIWIQSEERI